MTRVTIYCSLFIMLLAVMGAAIAQTPSMIDTSSRLQTDNLIRVPETNYRRDWNLLGSFSILADQPEKGAKELYVVYAEPASVAAYRKTGVFPDGTVIVKDVFATKTEALTTGTVSYADRLVGRFVMVKDTGNRYAGTSPLWGDGWGWGFFEGDETRKTVTTDYTVDCLGCHEPARSQDLLYVQGYPILKR